MRLPASMLHYVFILCSRSFGAILLDIVYSLAIDVPSSCNHNTYIPARNLMISELGHMLGFLTVIPHIPDLGFISWQSLFNFLIIIKFGFHIYSLVFHHDSIVFHGPKGFFLQIAISSRSLADRFEKNA